MALPASLPKLFYVHLFHLIIVGAFLLYIGIVKTNMPPFMYKVIFAVGILIVLLHGYKAIVKYGTPKSYLWVNLFHIFIVAPVLLMIGWYGAKTPSYYFQFDLMLAFAAIGYHGYFIVKELIPLM
jgi:purine-cytosine permease-like protein